MKKYTKFLSGLSNEADEFRKLYQKSIEERKKIRSNILSDKWIKKGNLQKGIIKNANFFKLMIINKERSKGLLMKKHRSKEILTDRNLNFLISNGSIHFCDPPLTNSNNRILNQKVNNEITARDINNSDNQNLNVSSNSKFIRIVSGNKILNSKLKKINNYNVSISYPPRIKTAGYNNRKSTSYACPQFTNSMTSIVNNDILDFLGTNLNQKNKIEFTNQPEKRINFASLSYNIFNSKNELIPQFRKFSNRHITSNTQNNLKKKNQWQSFNTSKESINSPIAKSNYLKYPKYSINLSNLNSRRKTEIKNIEKKYLKSKLAKTNLHNNLTTILLNDFSPIFNDDLNDIPSKSDDYQSKNQKKEKEISRKYC